MWGITSRKGREHNNNNNKKKKGGKGGRRRKYIYFIQYLKDYPTGHEVLIEGFSRTGQMTRKKKKIEVRDKRTLLLTKSATFQDGGVLHEISVDSRARGIRVCHLSWTNQRTFFWTIKRKPTFWTTSLLTRTHPLLLKPFLLGRHLYKKRLTLIVYRQRKLLRLWDLCRISPRVGVTKSLIAWWRRLALLLLVRL